MDNSLERLALLYSPEQMEKLQKACVLILGIGGVGSFAAEALARSGIGKLILVDHDVNAISNLNRQLQVTYDTLDMPKVEAMKQRIHAISKHCQVETKQTFVTLDNLDLLMSDKVDFVIDACDTVTVKLALLEYCYAAHIPLISSMGMANKVDPTKIEIIKLSKTYNDPLCKVMRRELKRKHFKKDPLVVFSSEMPRKIDYKGVSYDPNATRKTNFTPGSTAFVPSVSGLVCASHVVCMLTTIDN